MVLPGAPLIIIKNCFNSFYLFVSDSCDEIPKKKTSKQSKQFSSSCTMVNSSTDKNLKNYLYDNPQLKESKTKKASADIDDALTSSDYEVWLLQCPKNFDPQKLLCSKLGQQSKVECSADRFGETKTLAVIAPEKAAEYEMICDNLKLVKPVGKIVLSEKYGNDEDDCESVPSKKRSKASEKQLSQSFKQPSSGATSCDSDESMNVQSDERILSEPEPEPTPSRSKKLNDQKFTIETTVKVEKCGDRRKGKKKSDEKCLPLVPPEPSPLKKKKSSKH